MILAAGRGERLRPITDELPKALVEVGGRALIERHLEALASAGIRRVVINLGWLGWQIADRIGSGQRYGLEVVYSPEDDQILETGGGIRRALPMLGDQPFWVINADIATNYAPREVELAEDDVGHLVLVPSPAYRETGDFELDDAGRVRNAAQPSLTFAGMAVYRPGIVSGEAPGRFGLAPILRAAADAGRLRGEIYTGLWEDVGTPDRLEALDRKLSAG